MCIRMDLFIPKYSGRTIIKVRKYIDMTPTMLASVLGVSYKTLALWESGAEEMPLPERRIFTKVCIRGFFDFWLYKFMR